jgi:archaellum biogenesis ATPase FlaH
MTFNDKDRKLNHHDLKAVLNQIKIDKKLILVVDEFPDVLEKINTEHNHAAAESFLSGFRELWQDPELDKKYNLYLQAL